MLYLGISSSLFLNFPPLFTSLLYSGIFPENSLFIPPQFSRFSWEISLDNPFLDVLDSFPFYPLPYFIFLCLLSSLHFISCPSRVPPPSQFLFSQSEDLSSPVFILLSLRCALQAHIILTPLPSPISICDRYFPIDEGFSQPLFLFCFSSFSLSCVVLILLFFVESKRVEWKFLFSN